MNMKNRRIAHLDMDAFYASVELLRYPELRGLPVVIGGRSVHQPIMQQNGTCLYAKLREYSGRSVVTTSTYEARAYGIFSAMGIMQAAKLAPDAILLPADFDTYLFSPTVCWNGSKIKRSGSFFQILQMYS
ncbi:DNA polymerase-4 [Nitrosomonas eutropha]|nr:DNA polymerase-4 [Nitrosomonas eutropha]